MGTYIGGFAGSWVDVAFVFPRGGGLLLSPEEEWPSPSLL